jgi:hypothetical protein
MDKVESTGACFRAGQACSPAVDMEAAYFNFTAYFNFISQNHGDEPFLY